MNVVAFRFAELEVLLRSPFRGAHGGLPSTYASARIAEATAPGLVIEIERAPEWNDRPRAANHPAFSRHRDGDVLVVERNDCAGRVELTGVVVRARFRVSDDPPALEACVRVALSVALPRHGQLIVHASAVRWRGQALVFSGVSGAGKSTIAELLSRSFPGCERMADDLVVLARTPSGWQLHVPPFLGLEDLPRGEIAPLGAVHLIAQAAAPRREVLAPTVAMRELLRHVVVYAAEPSTTEHVLALTSQLIAEIPCVRLEFANDSSVGPVLGIT